MKVIGTVLEPLRSHGVKTSPWQLPLVKPFLHHPPKGAEVAEQHFVTKCIWFTATQVRQVHHRLLLLPSEHHHSVISPCDAPPDCYFYH